MCIRDRYTTTGHPMNSSYTLEKLMWGKAKMPDVYKKTYKILSAKDYIIYKLTGQFLMDVSNGSATNAMDIREMNWSGKLIEGAGVDGEMFPELRDATYVTGEVSASMSLECGLAAGTPVVLGGGDGQCASVGAGSVAEGLTYISAGSSSWISTASKIPVFDKDMTITNFAHIVPGYVCPSGTMQTAGSALNWVKNTICRYETAEAKQSGGSPYDSMNEQIAASVPGAGGLLFLPYLMGERAPRWNPNAKGAFIGLKLSNTRGDILRSVIEGIGMNLDIILNTLRHDIPIREMGIIGGMAKGNIVCQIFADIMGMNTLYAHCSALYVSAGQQVSQGETIAAIGATGNAYGPPCDRPLPPALRWERYRQPRRGPFHPYSGTEGTPPAPPR